MTVRKNLALILLIVVATQISLKDGKSTAIHTMNSYLGKATKPQKGNYAMFGKHFPLEKSMYKIYSFPDVEYPLVDFHRIPFYSEENLNIFGVDKIFPSIIQNKAINNFKKEKRMNRILEKLHNDQNYHIKREMPSLTKHSIPFESLCIKNTHKFPEVQYPINVMETWVPSYWNPPLYINNEKREPSYLSPPKLRRKSKKTYQFYKQPLQSKVNQFKEGKEKRNDKSVHSTQSDNNYEKATKSDSSIHSSLFKDDFTQNNSTKEVVHFNEKKQGTSLNTVTARKYPLKDNTTTPVPTQIEPDILFVTPMPLPYKFLIENNTCPYNTFDKTKNIKVGNNNIMKKEMKLNVETSKQAHKDTDTGPWNVKIPIPFADTCDDITTNYTVTKQNSDRSGGSIIIVPINIKIISEVPKNVLIADDITTDNRSTDNNKDVLTNFITEPTFNSNNDGPSLQMRSTLMQEAVTDINILNTIENTTFIMDEDNIDNRGTYSQLKDFSPYIPGFMQDKFLNDLIISQVPFIYAKPEDQTTNIAVNNSHQILKKMPDKLILNILNNDQSSENMLTREDMPFLAVTTQQPIQPIEVVSNILINKDCQKDLIDIDTNNSTLTLDHFHQGDTGNSQTQQMSPVKNMSEILDTIAIKDALHMFLKGFSNETQDYNNLFTNKITDVLRLFLNKFNTNSGSVVARNAIKENSQTYDYKAYEVIPENKTTDASNNPSLSITQSKNVLIKKSMPLVAVSTPQQEKSCDITKYSLMGTNSQTIPPVDVSKSTSLWKQESRHQDILPEIINKRERKENLNNINEDVKVVPIADVDTSSLSLTPEAHNSYNLLNEETQCDKQKLTFIANENVQANNWATDVIKTISLEKIPLLSHALNQILQFNGSKNIEMNENVQDISYSYMLPNFWTLVALLHNFNKSVDRRNHTSPINIIVPENVSDDELKPNDSLYTDMLLSRYEDLSLTKNSSQSSKPDLLTQKDESILEHEVFHFIDNNVQSRAKDMEIRDVSLADVIDIELPLPIDTVPSNIKKAIEIPQSGVIMELKKEVLDYLQADIDEDNIKFLLKYIKTLKNMKNLMKQVPADSALVNISNYKNLPISTNRPLQQTEPIDLPQILQKEDYGKKFVTNFINSTPPLISVTADIRDAVLPFIDAELGNAAEEHVSNDNYHISKLQLDLILNELENELLVNNREPLKGFSDVIRDILINEDFLHNILVSKVENSNSTLSVKSIPSVVPSTDDPAYFHMRKISPSKNASENLDTIIIKNSLQHFFKDFSNKSINTINKMKLKAKAQDNDLTTNIITNALQLFLNKLRMKPNNTVEVERNAIKDPESDDYKGYQIIPEYKIINVPKNDLLSPITPSENDVIKKNLTLVAVPTPQQEKLGDITKYSPKDANLQNIPVVNGSKNSTLIIQESLHQDVRPDMITRSAPLQQILAPSKHIKHKNLQFDGLKHNVQGFLNILEDKYINAVDESSLAQPMNEIKPKTKSNKPLLENMTKESFPLLADDMEQLTQSIDETKTPIDDIDRSDTEKHIINQHIADEDVQSDNLASKINKDILFRNCPSITYTTLNQTQPVNASKDIRIKMSDDVQEIPIAYMLPDNFWNLVGLQYNSDRVHQSTEEI